MNESSALAALSALGFTDLEARIYCELARSGAATGYGVAKAIGRPGANVYQALNSMQQKGAVLLADAASKAYRALPAEELLATMERGFRARLDTAEEALSTIAAAAPDDLLYKLASADQAYEHARAMIARAESIILFDLFPGPFGQLQALLTDAQNRGVRVAGTVYEGVAASERQVAHLAPNAAQVRETYPGAIMTIVADARQYLETLVTSDGRGLLNGVWTDSPYLACAKHSALGTEIRLNLLLQEHDDPFPEISLMGSNAPGLADIRQARKPDRDASG